MKKDSKQRLFEMMSKVDTSFKKKLNENIYVGENAKHQFKDNLQVKVARRDVYINDKSLFYDILPEIGDSTMIGLKGDLNNYFNFLNHRDGGFSEEKLENNRLFRVNIQHAWDLYKELEKYN